MSRAGGAGDGVRRVEAVLGRLPEVVEVDWRGNRTYMVGKRSFLGLDDGGLACRTDKDERPALVQRPWYTAPPFVARYGWVGVRFDLVDDWDEIDEVVETAYRITAPKRLVRLLENPLP